MKIVFVLLGLIACALAAPRVYNSDTIPLTDKRVIVGVPVDIADYPYQVSLQYYGSHICGGSIISTKYVVTAAHCTDGFSAPLLSVRAGSSLCNVGGQVFNISKIYQHPNYNRNTIDNDISILELETEIKIPYAEPIPLPESNAIIPVGVNATITGWGITSNDGTPANQLQMIELTVVSRETCRAAYGESVITDNMLCTGLTEGGNDACQKGSGDPLAVGGLLVGIASWGYGCGRPNYPGVYSSIPALRTYIKEITNL